MCLERGREGPSLTSLPAAALVFGQASKWGGGDRADIGSAKGETANSDPFSFIGPGSGLFSFQ